jgi:hypothetical protein
LIFLPFTFEYSCCDKLNAGGSFSRKLLFMLEALEAGFLRPFTKTRDLAKYLALIFCPRKSNTTSLYLSLYANHDFKSFSNGQRPH